MRKGEDDATKSGGRCVWRKKWGKTCQWREEGPLCEMEREEAPQPTLSGGPEVVTTKKRLRKENFLVSLV